MSNKEKFNYYIGPETAKTIANGLQTVYTCQQKSASQIESVAKTYNAKHVRIGYKGTFQKNKLYPAIISELVNKGYKVTLEYPADMHDIAYEIIGADLWSHYNFIPMMVVTANKVSIASKNQALTVLDDTANGEWSFTVSNILANNNFSSDNELSNIVGYTINDTYYKSQKDSNE
jgi:hypothetical protein